MSVLELTDDPFKAALGNTRGTGQSGDDADDVKAASKAAAERLDLDDNRPEGAFIVIYPDGSFLEHSETTGKTWTVQNFANATIFLRAPKAIRYMNMCETKGGLLRKIDALLLEPLKA